MSRAWLIVIVSIFVAAAVALVMVFGPFDWRNERVQQAGVAGLVIALGWFAGFVLREISQQLGRAERLRDAHRALYAEIQHNVANLGDEKALQAFGTGMLTRITEGDGFVPFIPRERNDAMFRAIMPQIHILPRATIDPVVQYYSQLGALDALVDDMRGDSFKTMSPQRKAQLYSDYIGLKLSALDYGTEAMHTINTYSRDGAARAHAVSEKLRADRSQRDRASGTQPPANNGPHP